MKNIAEPQPSPGRLVKRIIRLPRVARIAMAAVFALSVTLAITPVIDGFYMVHMFDMSTRELPALVSTGLGVVFYVIGWRVIVGFRGETPQPRVAVLWYFTVGALALAVVVVLVIFGAISGTLE